MIILGCLGGYHHLRKRPNRNSENAFGPLVWCVLAHLEEVVMTVRSDAVSMTDRSEEVYCRCGHDTAQSSSPTLLHVISIIYCILHLLVVKLYFFSPGKRYVMRLHMLCAALEVWEISRLVENLPRTSKTPQRPSTSAWFLAATLR